MRRRQFVATTGVLALAGCAGSDDQDPGSSENATDTETSSNTTDDNGDPPEDEDPESTPEPGEQAAQHIDAAREQLSAAIDDIEDQVGPNRSLPDLDASREIDADPISEFVDEAQSELTEAGSDATDEQNPIIEDLDTVANWIHYLMRAQEYAHTLYGTANIGLDALYDRDYDDASSTFDGMDGDIRRLENNLDIIQDLDGDAFGVIDVIPGDYYDESVERIGSELGTFTHVRDVGRDISSNTETFEDAADTYQDGEYLSASSEFWSLEREFEDRYDDLEAHDPAGVLSSRTSTLADFAGVMDDVSHHLYEAAEARDDDSQRAQHEANARQAWERWGGHEESDLLDWLSD